MYITATFPYVVTTAFLVRSSTLEGAMDGLYYMISPDVCFKIFYYNFGTEKKYSKQIHDKSYLFSKALRLKFITFKSNIFLQITVII